jgi:Uma2 family endonuclease
MLITVKTNKMQTAKQTEYISEEDYLAAELEREIKHEYVDGQVFAMAGASRNHVVVVQNIAELFGAHLRKSPCVPMGSDMKLKTPSGRYRYPDFMVVCDETGDNEYYKHKPVILVEVLSRSTRKNDEQIKRIEYINIPALKEYVLIEQDLVKVSVHRKSDHWNATHYYLDDEVVFESIELTLPVEELYHRVDNLDMNEWLEAEKD